MDVKKIPVSIIIPMLNSETTILLTLKSLYKQNYPIKEIIIVDNASVDDSVNTVKRFIHKNNKIPTYLLVNKKNIGVAGSYNRGIEKSKGKLFVMMHSDSTLPTSSELKKLTLPFYKEQNVVATYSYIILPKKIWLTYNFWQKLLLAKTVDKKMPGLNTKFDCIDRKSFDSIGGFDAKNYGHHIGVGSEDAAIHFALKRIGKVVKTNAQVMHLHYLGSKYTFKQLLQSKRLLARSYGRLVRFEKLNLGAGLILLLAKPILLLTLISSFFYNPLFIIIIIFLILNDWGMYSRIHDILDIRILLVPFISLILIFLESFWFIESFFFLNIKRFSLG